MEKENMDDDSVEENRDKKDSPNSKTNHYYDRYHNHPGMILLMLLGLLVIAGGFFCLGRISSRNFDRFERRNIVWDSPMMGGRFEDGRGFGMHRERRAGLNGDITAVNGNKITVKINSNEYTVNVADTTSITNNGNIAKLSDLKVGNNVLIFGTSTSNGEITATQINVY